MNTDTATAIINAWETAYGNWENGMSSPSANDLVAIANNIDPSLPADDDTAERLYAVLCDGTDLTTAYGAVYGTVGK